MKRQVIFAGDMQSATPVHTLATGAQEYWRDNGETGTRSGLVYYAFTLAEGRDRVIRSDNPCIKVIGKSRIVQPFDVIAAQRFIQAATGTNLNLTKRTIW